jgi:hypothetical protein
MRRRAAFSDKRLLFTNISHPLYIQIGVLSSGPINFCQFSEFIWDYVLFVEGGLGSVFNKSTIFSSRSGEPLQYPSFVIQSSKLC